MYVSANFRKFLTTSVNLNAENCEDIEYISLENMGLSMKYKFLKVLGSGRKIAFSFRLKCV